MLRRVRIAACCIALTAGAACSDDDPILPDRFTLSLALDNGPDGSCDVASTCESFPISCGAVVGVRLLDLPQNATDQPAEREAACVRVPSDDREFPLCALGTGSLNVNFERIPRENGMVEVVVWPDPDPAAQPTCPVLEFDAFGRVKTGQFDPDDPGAPAEPSFARREYFDFSGEDEVATVHLGCHNPELIGPSCKPISTYVRADVFNINSLGVSIGQMDQPENLAVTFGKPVQLSDTNYRIEDPIPLTLVIQGGFAPIFETTVGSRFTTGDDMCVLVRDVITAGTVTASRCTRIADGSADEIILPGAFIERDELNQILTAAGLDAFPASGVVVGRVIDRGSFQPVAGVSVIPNDGSQVLYLNTDVTSTDGLTVTSSSGYFVATDAVSTTLWSAERGDGLESQNPPPRGGNLENNVTVIVLTMAPSVAE